MSLHLPRTKYADIRQQQFEILVYNMKNEINHYDEGTVHAIDARH